MDESSRLVYEFAGFRLDVATQTLWSPDGQPLPVPSRAFAALQFLLERAGELVEKSALMSAVWPKSVVEENNLSHCIMSIRRALGESAGERRFILTVPGRGFKFIAPVRVTARALEEPPADGMPRPAQSGVSPKARTARWPTMAAACAVALLLGLAAFRYRPGAQPVTSPAEYEPLTDVTDSATAPAISADGHLLAFIRNGSPFMGSGQIWLKLLPDGEPIPLTHVTGAIFAPAFTPDNAHVVFTRVPNTKPDIPWDTWTIPISGGEATPLLPNASGLNYLAPHEVMYSEFKSGLHLGIATSGDDRSHHRDVYLPGHERGMAHFSYLSPDHRSVLIVEMGPNAEWQRCRLVPFDGSSPGTPIGPQGACTSAAWSPDGRWMYLSIAAEGHSHLWRQRYPGGTPQQITFGTSDENTVAVAPDGRSLLTSIGREQPAIWLHDAQGDRALTSEGIADQPWLSSDGHRLYFRVARNNVHPATELWRMEIASATREPLITGLAVNSYDVSSDEQWVVFTTGHGSSSQIWIAPTDRHSAPVQLVSGGDEPAFDAQGHIFFRAQGARVNQLRRMSLDGSGNVPLLDTPILELHGVSPDGRWVAADLPAEGSVGAFLVPVDGGTPYLLARGWSPSRWSRNDGVLYVEAGSDISDQTGRTLVLRLKPDGTPVAPVRPAPAGALIIPHAEVALSVSADPTVYAYLKVESRWNIFRIPLH
jgi:DNA-binding winged helix-turn-helix (wHTH) protein/Tol biopolymer transport system component